MNTETISISKAIKQMDFPKTGFVSTDEEGYWNFNIGFIHGGHEDETQFDILPANFDYIQRKCPELEELWFNFCKEEGICKNSIIYIEIGQYPITKVTGL